MGEVRAGPVAGERISVCRLDGAFPTKPRSEVFVENLIANFIENGRQSIKFTKVYGQLAKNALLGQALDRAFPNSDLHMIEGTFNRMAQIFSGFPQAVLIDMGGLNTG